MERTLFPNDYVLVNKVSYGTKIPKRIQDVPVVGSLFKEKYMQHQYDLYSPLKSFKNYKREDIVVFKSVENNAKFLIKRIIGLPGDILKIEKSKVYINDTLLKEKDVYCYSYIEYNASNIKLYKTFSNKEFNSLDDSDKLKYKKNTQDSLRSNLYIFPITKQDEWTRDNYGEIIIPKKGLTIVIDSENFDLYKGIIKNYERETIEISNEEQKEYTFKNNYYFMMGDNRHNSVDSRSYGFVPESYIQGKMIAKF